MSDVVRENLGRRAALLLADCEALGVDWTFNTERWRLAVGPRPNGPKGAFGSIEREAENGDPNAAIFLRNKGAPV